MSSGVRERVRELCECGVVSRESRKLCEEVWGRESGVGRSP